MNDHEALIEIAIEIEELDNSWAGARGAALREIAARLKEGREDAYKAICLQCREGHALIEVTEMRGDELSTRWEHEWFNGMPMPCDASKLRVLHAYTDSEDGVARD